jgi:hypothetical protein
MPSSKRKNGSNAKRRVCSMGTRAGSGCPTRSPWSGATVAVALVLLTGCGSETSDPPQPTAAQAPQPTVEQTPTPTVPAAGCREPSGQEKASLRFAVRAHDRELKDDPWALVRKGGVNYMAAEIDGDGARLVVLVRFPQEGKYLSGMKAINGTARTFTDLPNSSDTIPKAGKQALDCVTG